jgi:uncharacterized protein YjbI with pentapeptide repeats
MVTEAEKLKALEKAVEKATKLQEADKFAQAISALDPAIAAYDGRVPEDNAWLQHQLEQALLIRGTSHWNVHTLDKARADFERAAKVQPTGDWSRAYLAELSYEEGKHDEAVKIAVKALQRPPGSYALFELLKTATLANVARGDMAEASEHGERIRASFTGDKSKLKDLLTALGKLAQENPSRARDANALVAKLGGGKPKKSPRAAKTKKAKKSSSKEKPRPRPRPAFSKEQQAILDAHALWVSSKGKKGARFSAENLAAFAGEDGRPVLRGAFLEKADLGAADHEGSPVDFSGANLAGAIVTAANFLGSNFDGADLRGVEFVDSTFEGCSFEDADLSGADLRGADCHSWESLKGARYDGKTRYDDYLDPEEAGMRRV